MVEIKSTEYGGYDIVADGIRVGVIEMSEDGTYLERIDVFDEYQRKGYGTAALKALADEIGNFCLTPDSEDSKRLYDRIGSEISRSEYDAWGWAVDQGYGVYEIS